MRGVRGLIWDGGKKIQNVSVKTKKGKKDGKHKGESDGKREGSGWR